MKKKIIIQALFWAFIFVYIFDYFKEEGDYELAFRLSAMELGIYLLTAYVNLWVLIPRFVHRKLLYIGSLVLYLFALLTGYTLFGWEEELMGEVSTASKISFAINYVVFILFSLLYWYVEEYQKEQQRALKLENEKLVAEMKALKSQVSPHFLFNSLNNIYSLCLSNPEGAAAMVEKLSEVLRYLTYEGTQDKVLLQQEVKMITDFVALQKMKKLQGGHNITLEVDEHVHQYKIIPLVLISLVENAFSHGDIATNEQGKLRIAIQQKHQQVVVAITNTFNEQTMPQKQEGGIGLRNIQQQLDLHYPNRYSFETKKENQLFRVKLAIDVDNPSL